MTTGFGEKMSETSAMWNNNSHSEASFLTLRPVDERFLIPKASSRNETRSASTQMQGRFVRSMRPSKVEEVSLVCRFCFLFLNFRISDFISLRRKRSIWWYHFAASNTSGDQRSYCIVVLPFSVPDPVLVHLPIRIRASCAPFDDKGRFIVSKTVRTSTSSLILPSLPPRCCFRSFSPHARDSNRQSIRSLFGSAENTPTPKLLPSSFIATLTKLRASVAARTL
mmetsp:Transcript_21805/g.51728  ORF Transcript_21805/g.51728 Transcript_21805/m.51728 type:complete len:224 (+) Transcript_21805:1021-1692(+)